VKEDWGLGFVAGGLGLRLYETRTTRRIHFQS